MVFIPVSSSAFELGIFPLPLLEQGAWGEMARFPVLHGLAAAAGSSPAQYRCGERHSNPSWPHGMGMGLALP